MRLEYQRIVGKVFTLSEGSKYLTMLQDFHLSLPSNVLSEILFHNYLSSRFSNTVHHEEKRIIFLDVFKKFKNIIGIAMLLNLAITFHLANERSLSN